MRNLDVALLFKQMDIYDDLTVMVPVSVVCGKADEKRMYFEDAFSKQLYINSDVVLNSALGSSFNCVLPSKSLSKKYKFCSFPEACKKYFLESQENVYFYADDYVMKTLPIEEFNEKYGLKIQYFDSSDLKTEIDKVLNGEKSEFIEERHDLKKITDYKISDICNGINKEVIAQDSAIRKIVTAIYRNALFDDPKMKSNIFVYGPTGVGKTQIVRTLGKMFDIPVLIEDMTRYTSAGYKGADIENILVKLYNNANGDLELAQKSILVLDEIDKKAVDSSDNNFQKGDVLKSLLKIIEGGVFDIEIGHETINFDTSKLTVITCGAFSDIYEKIKPRKYVGFNAPDNQTIDNTQEVSIEAFEKYGLPIEFMGRMDTIVRLNSLSKDDLIKILKESEISPLKIYLESFKKINVNIEFPDSLYEKIASIALSKYKTGARSLKIIVDEMFSDVMYRVFDSLGQNQKVGFTSDTVENNKAYTYKLEKKL